MAGKIEKHDVEHPDNESNPLNIAKRQAEAVKSAKPASEKTKVPERKTEKE